MQNTYKWEVPSIPNPEPMRPFRYKIPMEMIFGDSIGKFYQYNKGDGSLQYVFTSLIGSQSASEYSIRN